MNLYEFDRWVLECSRRRLQRDDGYIVPLSSSEFHLLKVFLDHPHTTLSRDRIIELTRVTNSDVFDRSVDSQISRFRRKLEVDAREPKLIRTIWGDGYIFDCDVRRI